MSLGVSERALSAYLTIGGDKTNRIVRPTEGSKGPYIHDRLSRWRTYLQQPEKNVTPKEQLHLDAHEAMGHYDSTGHLLQVLPALPLNYNRITFNLFSLHFLISLFVYHAPIDTSHTRLPTPPSHEPSIP